MMEPDSRSTAREPTTTPGHDARAAAHRRTVARLGRDIADAVRALDRRVGLGG